MDETAMLRLLSEESGRRITTEKLRYSDYTYKYRNSFIEDLLQGRTVELYDGSTLFMVLDDVKSYRADWDGNATGYDDSWGWVDYAEGKTILVRHTDDQGIFETFWELDIYDDSWDNGYSDEWTLATVRKADWIG